MPEIRAVEDRVGAYWDALVVGRETTNIDIDPGLAQAIQHFQDLSAVPPPGARERVRRRLGPLVIGEAPVAEPFALLQPSPMPAAPAIAMNGHRAAAVSRVPQTPLMRLIGRWAFTHLATAALLILTLTVGFAAIWQRPAVREDDPVHRPALIRVADTSPGDVVDELIFAETFTTEELPSGSPQAIFYRVTLPPGVSLSSLMGPFCLARPNLFTSGVGIEVVQSGAYSLQLDAPIRIERQGSSLPMEEIPAGTEVALDPGDVAIYPKYATQGTIRNTGDKPVIVLGVAIVDAEGSGLPTPKVPTGVRTEYLAGTGPSEWRSLPAGPVTVSLWQLTLPEGTSVGPYEATGLESLRVERGAITRSFLGAGETKPRGRPLFAPAGTSSPFLVLKPGVRRTIVSAGGEPAMLLALSIEPFGISSATLTP